MPFKAPWILCGLACAAALAPCGHAEPAGRFDRGAWSSDYRFLKRALERSHANLAWLASPGSGVDLAALDRRTQRALDSAANDEDARAAILGFIEGMHDGHLERVATLESAAAPAASPPPVALDPADAAGGCAALGYAPIRSIAFTLPFDALGGFALESDGVARVFRSGIATTPAKRRIGILRIARFRSKDAPPAACIEAWDSETKAGHAVDADILAEKVELAWFGTLARQLRRFHDEGAAAVLVDVGGNTGGNDSGDWAARLFTPHDVHSARLLMVAAPESNAYFDEQLEGLRDALGSHPDISAEARQALAAGIAAFERRKQAIGMRQCDLSWVWRERRPWDPAGCSRLVEAGFASGQADFLPAGAMGGPDIAGSLYWPSIVDPFRGAWSGPVYVLTDGRTASSAEMFAAVMRDNGIARIVGTATEGDGCGFMLDQGPVELPHSHLRFLVPNCVRLRADGTDEVAGIEPDLPALPRQGEDGRARAARVLDMIDADLRAAEP